MRKFLVGAILTYVGFALFLLGFIISTLPIPALDNVIMALIPMGMAAVLVGVVIQILSGILGVTGLLLCIASVSKPTPAPVTIIQQIPIPTPPPPPTPVRSPTPTVPPPQSSTCKYCGHYIQPSEFFCPSCNRAQR
jgi:hypothetical protein